MSDSLKQFDGLLSGLNYESEPLLKENPEFQNMKCVIKQFDGLLLGPYYGLNYESEYFLEKVCIRNDFAGELRALEQNVDEMYNEYFKSKEMLPNINELEKDGLKLVSEILETEECSLETRVFPMKMLTFSLKRLYFNGELKYKLMIYYSWIDIWPACYIEFDVNKYLLFDDKDNLLITVHT